MILPSLKTWQDKTNYRIWKCSPGKEAIPRWRYVRLHKRKCPGRALPRALTRAVTASMQAALLMRTWLESHESIDDRLSPRAAEALAVARWDQYLISAKLQRALRGLDEYLHGESAWDDPIQNDWNGSAKLTLICIARSIEAWQTLGEELGDPEAKAVAMQLRGLEQEVKRAFPDAARFIRPGFDEEGENSEL